MNRFFPIAAGRLAGLSLVWLSACGGGDSAPDKAAGTPSAAAAAAATGAGAVARGEPTAQAQTLAAPVSAGQWSPLIPLPLVASSAAHLPNGK
ncbi:MAG: hypothetical protein V4739_01835, partial [Pseudomonadota bacterium]